MGGYVKREREGEEQEEEEEEETVCWYYHKNVLREVFFGEVMAREELEGGEGVHVSGGGGGVERLQGLVRLQALQRVIVRPRRLRFFSFFGFFRG